MTKKTWRAEKLNDLLKVSQIVNCGARITISQWHQCLITKSIAASQNFRWPLQPRMRKPEYPDKWNDLAPELSLKYWREMTFQKMVNEVVKWLLCSNGRQKEIKFTREMMCCWSKRINDLNWKKKTMLNFESRRKILKKLI